MAAVSVLPGPRCLQLIWDETDIPRLSLAKCKSVLSNGNLLQLQACSLSPRHRNWFLFGCAAAEERITDRGDGSQRNFLPPFPQSLYLLCLFAYVGHSPVLPLGRLLCQTPDRSRPSRQGERWDPGAMSRGPQQQFSLFGGSDTHGTVPVLGLPVSVCSIGLTHTKLKLKTQSPVGTSSPGSTV